jgi:hypothetical protein
MKACTLAAFLVLAAAGPGGTGQFATAQITQQLEPPFANSSSCNLDALSARVQELQTACSSLKCDIKCAGKLLPLLDDCRDVLMRLYDGADGDEDGQSAILNDAYADCCSMPASDLIGVLQALHEQGRCPNSALDGVAETQLELPKCADAAGWEGGRCAMSIASTILTCGRDFCNTVPTRDAPCMMAGQCDQTCRFCSAEGDSEGAGHRRLLLAALRESRRRLQMSHVTCDPATFAQQAHAVDDACCDADTGANKCDEGTPGSCDAKCAVVFNSFYDRCQRFLAAQMSMAQMAAYDLLYGTCTRALPSEPLLRAAIACAADPCKGLHCGEHGRCDVGSCRCELGYSGIVCEFFDPCVGVECGHGSCNTGSCDCDHGYSGSHCETADPCQVPEPITCGSHGSCAAGKCVCEEKYTGTLCETPPKPCCTISATATPLRTTSLVPHLRHVRRSAAGRARLYVIMGVGRVLTVRLRWRAVARGCGVRAGSASPAPPPSCRVRAASAALPWAVPVSVISRVWAVC